LQEKEAQKKAGISRKLSDEVVKLAEIKDNDGKSSNNQSVLSKSKNGR